MKTTTFLSIIIAVSICFTLKSQTYIPVSVTGFNYDGIAEVFPNSIACTSGALDLTMHALYSQTFAAGVGIGGGIPNSGTIVNGSSSYQLQSFNSSNLLRLTGGSGNLTLTTPSAYESISLIAFSTEGSSTLNITLNFTSGPSSNYGNFNIFDWFGGGGAIYAGCGRVVRATTGSYVGDGLPTDPRFYPMNISLSCADRARVLQSITINHTAGSFAYIIALSGALNPAVSINSQAICSGTSATLTATPSIAGGSYSWNPGGATSAVVNLNPASTTTYTCTYTYTGCPITATGTVTVNPSPAVVAEQSLTYCSGATVLSNSFTSIPVGATFIWTNSNSAIGLASGGTDSLSAFTATNTTGAPIVSTITVTPTLAGCVGVPFTFTITINPIPTVVAEPNLTYCSGASIPSNSFVGIPVGTTFTWTNSNSSIGLASSGTDSLSAFTATNTTGVPIISTITITPMLAGCTGTPSAFTITINPSPSIVSIPNLTFCSGVAVPSNSFASIPAGANYTWINSNNSIGLTSSGINSLPSFTASNATTAPIVSTITITPTLAGCVGVPSSFTITINPLPIITVNSPAICAGTSVLLTASGANSYSWTNGATSNSTTVAPGSTTTYTVTGTSLGCSSSALSTVTVFSSFTPNAGMDDTICYGSSITLGVIPNGSGYLYSWTPVVGIVGANTFNPVASPLTTTSYFVTVTDANGCSATDKVTIYVNAQINATVNAVNVTCNGACNGQATVIPSGGSSVYTYLWNSGCTTVSCTGLCPASYTVTVTDSWGCTATANSTITEPTVLTTTLASPVPASCNGSCNGTATVIANGGTIGSGYSYSWNTIPVQSTNIAGGLCAGFYNCTVTDVNGCSQTQAVAIPQGAGPTATISSDATITIGTTTSITAGGGVSYNWINASGLSCNNCANPVANPSQTTTYCVEVADSSGCKDTACAIVIVEFPCHMNEALQVPNAFSPNDDQINDAFCLQGWDACLESFKIIILNRLGEKVFESTNPNFCWDGKYFNETMDAQVLVYVLRARYINVSKLIEKRGNISLIR